MTDILTAKLVQEQGDTQYFAQVLPTRTVDRIAFLSNVGSIPKEISDPAIHAYSWFLQHHHYAQELYMDSGLQETVDCKFDADEFDFYQNTALAYCYLNSR